MSLTFLCIQWDRQGRQKAMAPCSQIPPVRTLCQGQLCARSHLVSTTSDKTTMGSKLVCSPTHKEHTAPAHFPSRANSPSIPSADPSQPLQEGRTPPTHVPTHPSRQLCQDTIVARAHRLDDRYRGFEPRWTSGTVWKVDQRRLLRIQRSFYSKASELRTTTFGPSPTRRGTTWISCAPLARSRLGASPWYDHSYSKACDHSG